MNAPKTVNFTNVATSAISTLTGLPTIARGLKELISTKPDKYKSIGQWLEKHAKKSPKHIAIRYEDVTYSYEELNEWVNRWSNYFLEKGLKQGDVIGISIENRPETMVAVLATVKIGAIASMINTSQRGEVLLHSINLVKPKLMIVGEEVLENMATVEESIDISLRTQLYFIKDRGQRNMPAHYQDIEKVTATSKVGNPGTTDKIQMKHPCYYIFTSGTTGLPKASVMTHFRWHKSMAGMGLASMRLNKHDNMYLPLPLYHNNALTVSLAAVLGAGACVTISRKFSVSRFWDEVREHKATAFCYIGELCRYLLNTEAKNNDRDHNIRVIIGNGLRPDIWMEFKNRFGIKHINEFYGASECNLVFTNALNLDCTAGICPLPYNIVEYDIDEDAPVRDAKGYMVPVKKGGTGLLITEISAKQPFEGYTDEEATNKKIFRDVFAKGDSWFNTGDMVINQGFKHIAFADRLGDTFRWKGENVATTEVEAVAAEYPGVEHAVAYGVEIPRTDGRAGMAALIMTPEAIENFDMGAFTRHMREKLPAYAIPLFLRLKQQEEVTGTFKYRKVELKKEAYDLGQVDEPLFVLENGSDSYLALDQTAQARIEAGEGKF